MDSNKQATYLITRLNQAGFEAYFVGGCVRDWLRGCEPEDWDIATAATPQEVHETLSDLHLIDTGIKHGTVTALLDDTHTEITTFRTEGPYLDGRRPSSVSFVGSIMEDLSRRDFTINAMAYHPDKGLIDPYGGKHDLEQGILRAVGDPSERLQEDALRIMRALRFAATLNLTLEKDLSRALHTHRIALEHIAAERIRNELMKLLTGQNILNILLEYPDVLSVPIPEIEPCIGFNQHSIYHCYDIWEHTAHAMALVKPDPLVRLTLLFHDLGKPSCFSLDERGRGHFYNHDVVGAEIAAARLRALRFDNETIDLVSKLIRWHSAFLRPAHLKRWLNRLGIEGVKTLIEVRRGDILSHDEINKQERNQLLEETEQAFADLLLQEPCFTRIDLAIDGNDIMELGIEEGPLIGRILDVLLDAVLDDALENERMTLISAARTCIEEKAL